MFSTKRPAKRSIIGTVVCAGWKDDSLYYPGIITSTIEWPNGEEVFSVFLRDRKTSKTYQRQELIGPGFQPITSAVLKNGQKVFITYNTRETTGTVISHDRHCDDVLITVDLPEGGQTEIIRKLEEIRLVESRKSTRLQHHDTDYSRMNDLFSEPKRRTVSHSIDVPLMKAPRRRRTYSSPSRLDEDEDDSTTVIEVVTDPSQVQIQMKEEKRIAAEVMDDTMAALVLTSLSSSPHTPTFPLLPDKFKPKAGYYTPPSSSTDSSGIWGLKSDSNTPSPTQYLSSCSTSSNPHYISSSVPADHTIVFGSPIDEGIEVDDVTSFITSEEPGSRKRRASTRTVFQCTWPQCGKLHNTCSGIEKHVRQAHLGPRVVPDGDESDLSDHEEEFYYTEIEVSVDTVTQTFADMHTSSPPPQSALYRDMNSTVATSPNTMSTSDHDYQRKTSPMSIPTSRAHVDQSRGGSLPGSLSMLTNKQSRSFSWQSSPSKMVKPSSPSHYGQVSRGYSTSVPTKSSPLHKKPRSDTKKCRKVYGMENRDLWCTQCKWKKACSRFVD